MKAKVEKIETNVVKLEITVEAEKFNAALTKHIIRIKQDIIYQGLEKVKFQWQWLKSSME